MKMTVGEIVEATSGKLVVGSTMHHTVHGATDVVTGISTDSRTIIPGDLFVALHGKNHDGHDHLKEVARKGVAVVVVDQDIPDAVKNQIRVRDTLKALGDIAHAWRKRFLIPVIAVTGSNGKTTTKDLIAAVLGCGGRRYCVLKTEGNFNNLIGLPQTLFRLNHKIEVAVLEMGMNQSGEIARLAQIAAPIAGVITNVARAHLEGLSTLDHVANAKGELLEGLPRHGQAILNADDISFEKLKSKARCPIVSFGSHPDADIRLLAIHSQGLDKTSFEVSLNDKRVIFTMSALGRHNVFNALAAIAVGSYLKVPVSEMKKALADFKPVSRRMEIVSLPGQIDIINDCYNANPDSVIASLEFLKETGGERRRVAILGEMLELGGYALKGHREVGSQAARAGVDLLFAIGKHARDMTRSARSHGVCEVFAFKSVEESLSLILSQIQPGDLVLIKGSRGMKMERITEEIKKHAA